MYIKCIIIVIKPFKFSVKPHGSRNCLLFSLPLNASLTLIRDKEDAEIVFWTISLTRKYALPLASLWTKLWRLSPDNFPKASLGHLNWIFLLEVFPLQQISCPSGDKVTCTTVGKKIFKSHGQKKLMKSNINQFHEYFP